MKNKGISLIVLIITIVVIIILATAIIVNIAQSNVIGNANEAVVKSDFKTLQDELDLYIADKYADTLGEFDATTLNAISIEDVIEILPSVEKSKYKEYVVIKNGKIEILDTMQEPEKTWAMEALGLTGTTNGYLKATVSTLVTTANSTITGENPTYNNPVIPVGFKAVETTKATWSDTNDDGVVDGWNNGLVIMDSNENEYVWIPVDGTNVKYEKWNSEVYHESISVKYEQTNDDSLPSGVVSEEYQITKYGGFYVARYEAGLPDSETTDELMLTKTFTEADNNRTDIGKAQSKTDKVAWTRISYTNAKIVSESVISTNYVQSGLVTGSQWDTMLKFIEQSGVNVVSDSTEWGNYKNRYGYTINGYYRTELADVVYTNGEYTKSSDMYLLLTTGKFGSVLEEGSPKNLYDVAGNVWEWSTENVLETLAENIIVDNKVLRGGSAYTIGTDRPASYRLADYNNDRTNYHVGFRFVLYVK